MTLVDSHCHLDACQFDPDRDAVVRRALDAGVTTMLTIGTGDGPPDLEAAIRLAEGYPCLLATVGVQPHDAAKADSTTIPRLRELARHPKVVALGEMGLDYFHDHAPRERQRDVFLEQLQLAREARKPVIIHTRDAWQDTFAILGEHWPEGLGGIFHCFTGGPEEARRALDLGFHLSFSGIVTYPKAMNVREAARATPLDRLLIETDAPYLAPAPDRKRRNEPAFVAETARQLAALRGEGFEDLARATAANFARLCLPSADGSG